MRLNRKLLFVVLLIIASFAVATAQTITKAPFGKTTDGQSVDLYTLKNTRGMEYQIRNGRQDITYPLFL